MDYEWISREKSDFWGRKVQKKKSSVESIFFYSIPPILYTQNEKEIVNRVRVSKRREKLFKIKMWSSWCEMKRNVDENVKSSIGEIWKLWKINGNVEKIEVKKIIPQQAARIFFGDKGKVITQKKERI